MTLPGGEALTLSPGGQNVLLKLIVENFCPHFTPGGLVLYVGDANSKWAGFDETGLAELGVFVDEHGKMPDLVVYLRDKNWLVLLEAASSHGPVDAQRHGELGRLFANSTASLVYVSCFPSRSEMRKYLTDIAWETDVWCADNPTHLIHFNGERFLGPYPSSPPIHRRRAPRGIPGTEMRASTVRISLLRGAGRAAAAWLSFADGRVVGHSQDGRAPGRSTTAAAGAPSTGARRGTRATDRACGVGSWWSRSSAG